MEQWWQHYPAEKIGWAMTAFGFACISIVSFVNAWYGYKFKKYTFYNFVNRVGSEGLLMRHRVSDRLEGSAALKKARFFLYVGIFFSLACGGCVAMYFWY